MFAKYFYLMSVLSGFKAVVSFAAFIAFNLFAVTFFFAYLDNKISKDKRKIITLGAIVVILTMITLLIPGESVIKAMLADKIVGDDFSNVKNAVDYVIEKIGENK